MKKAVIITVFLCLLGTLFTYAQQSIYLKSKVFSEADYAYQCDALERGGVAFVTLYNKDSYYKDTTQINRYTKKPISINENYEEQLYDPSVAIPPKMEKIICDAFSSEQKKAIKSYIYGETSLAILLYIHPDTGRIMDVRFQFLTIEPFGNIPVSVYRKIEVELKRQIKFVVTKAGKKRNYVFLGWMQKIE